MLLQHQKFNPNLHVFWRSRFGLVHEKLKMNPKAEPKNSAKKWDMQGCTLYNMISSGTSFPMFLFAYNLKWNLLNYLPSC